MNHPAPQSTAAPGAAPKVPTASLSLDTLPPEALTHLRDELRLNDAQIVDLIEAVNAGVRTVGDYLGYSEGQGNTLESVALAYYRHRRFDMAATVYMFVLEMFPQRASAWRGLGACAQVQKAYMEALVCYQHAMQIDPDELAAVVLLGECYCLLGFRERGLLAMQHALELPVRATWQQTYVKRAKAMLAAGGHAVTPPSKPEAEPGAPAVPPSRRDAQAALLAERLQKFSHMEGSAEAIAMLSQPGAQGMVERLIEGVDNELFVVNDIAGFTPEQMKGGYVAACAYLEQGQPLQALQIIGWLIYLDQRNASYLQLAGLAVHHMKLYCFADYLYGLALIQEPGDPTTLIYRGEAKILSEERHAGLELLRKGVQLCGGKVELADMAKRGRALIQQFDSSARSRNKP